MCIHNFVQMPCERHLQCTADCDDYVWKKSDGGRIEEVKRQYVLAYATRKKAEELSQGPRPRRSAAVSELSKDALLELEFLREQVREYERKEALWKRRWQQIAYHVRARGMQISKVDAPIPEGVLPPSERETAEILHLFNKEIPASSQA